MTERDMIISVVERLGRTYQVYENGKVVDIDSYRCYNPITITFDDNGKVIDYYPL